MVTQCSRMLCTSLLARIQLLQNSSIKITNIVNQSREKGRRESKTVVLMWYEVEGFTYRHYGSFFFYKTSFSISIDKWFPDWVFRADWRKHWITLYNPQTATTKDSIFNPSKSCLSQVLMEVVISRKYKVILVGGLYSLGRHHWGIDSFIFS